MLWLVLIVLAALCLWKLSAKPNWAPPGPRKLPILGSMLSLNFNNPSVTFTAWAKQFGKIYYVELGSQQNVILNDYNLIREAFSKPELAFRPSLPSFEFIVKGQGLALSNGELWQESRRCTLHALKNLGMGKSVLEGAITDQVNGFIDHVLHPNENQPLDVDRKLNAAVVNIIWHMMSSQHLDICDKSVLKAVGEIDELTTNDMEPMRFLDSFPFLINLVPKFIFDGAGIEKKFYSFVNSFLAPVIEDHRNNIDVSSEPKDYIEVLLQEQVKRPDIYTDQHIIMCILDLFFAGNDTTATTLRWALCFLCNEPEMMRRIQEEIDCVTGQSRPVCLADRTNMPFTEAFLLETQRRADIAPLGVPHSPVTTVNIGDYHIPPGVVVIANLRAVHKNADMFPQPELFDPGRFLTDDGKFVPDKKVIPFSIGKRQCPGEAMARSELFLFLTLILQKYSFRWPNGFQHPLTEEVKAGLILSPTSFKVVPIPRDI